MVLVQVTSTKRIKRSLTFKMSTGIPEFWAQCTNYTILTGNGKTNKQANNYFQLRLGRFKKQERRGWGNGHYLPKYMHFVLPVKKLCY